MSTPCVDESPIVILAIKDFQSVVGRSRDHASTIEVEVDRQDKIFVSGVGLLTCLISLGSHVKCYFVVFHLDFECEIALIDGHLQEFQR